MFLRLKDKIINSNRIISIEILDYKKEIIENGDKIDLKDKFYIRFTLDCHECYDTEDFVNKQDAEVFLDYITVQLGAIRADHL